MRYLFTLSLAVTSFLFANAENNGGCGTVTPANMHYNTSDAERSMVFNSSTRAGFRNVAVVYHVVQKTNGTNGITLKNLFDTHCELNKGFEESEMYFWIAAIDTIKDDALWAMNDGQGGTNYNLGYGAFGTYNEPDVVNVYITGELPGLCGFATFPGSAPNGGGLFLNKDCCGIGGTTIPHEMGHYFNLPHTFQQTNPVEYVDGSNCATKGDRFCDTPADPSEERAACPYTGIQTDPHGDLYNPDETLFMSYFSDHCVSRFSQQQRNEMNATLSSDRPSLMNHSPNVTPLDAVVWIQPLTGDTTAIGSSVVFKWHSVPRAKYYFLRVQLATSNLILIDTLVADTTFSTGGLQANKSYKYYVRAMCYENVCEGNAPYQYISTSLIKATFNVASPSCPGETDASIAVTPSNGFPPYTVAWSNSQSGTSISNLSPGIYTVTITDANGKVATATVNVTDPAPVDVAINRVGNNLNAYGTGGTPPYDYSWSDGFHGQFNNNVPAGDYTVTVTDAKGCTTTESFTVSPNTGIGVDLATKVSMKVFPNPASKVASINLQVELNERTEATIAITNVNGEVLMLVKREFANGVNNIPVAIDHLSSGIYFIQFRSSEITKTQRVSVIR